MAIIEGLASLELNKSRLATVHLASRKSCLPTWCVNITIVSLAASVYYGFSIIFPQMVFGIYTSDQAYGALLCCAVTAPFMLGAISAALSRYIGKQKVQIIVCSIIFTPLLGAIACATTDNRNTVLGLMITGCVFVGFVEGVGVTSTGISINDQKEIGTAVGVGSTLRATVATVATTIYVTVLTNRLATTIPQQVVPALAKTSLPATSYAGLIAGFSTGSFSGVAGATPEIIAIGLAAYRQALVLAFRTVFLTTIAFSGCVLILSFFFPNLDNKMTNKVQTTLHKTKNFSITSPKNNEEKQ